MLSMKSAAAGLSVGFASVKIATGRLSELVSTALQLIESRGPANQSRLSKRQG
jgi:hypothetical protein